MCVEFLCAACAVAVFAERVDTCTLWANCCWLSLSGLRRYGGWAAISASALCVSERDREGGCSVE